jgi:5-methylcytosine-specific restriction endonuclease McrA
MFWRSDFYYYRKLISFHMTTERKTLSIDEYLNLAKDQISIDEYLKLEYQRMTKLKKINADEWKRLLQGQNMKCHYCKTDIRVIQQLIVKKIISLRKRGSAGYSGLHFELDHKNADKTDNNTHNLVASCYFCNNDKSNTIDSDTFEKYFGAARGEAFIKLAKARQLEEVTHFHYHLMGSDAVSEA